MAQITTLELENMIRNKMREKGMSFKEMSDDLIEQVRDKVKEVFNEKKSQNTSPQPKTENPEEENKVLNVSPQETTDIPGEIPNPISSEVQSNPEIEQISKKEGELTEKEKILQQREEDIKRKEQELNRKEIDLSYKPQLPDFIDKIGPEKLFVFDNNELSVGGENLSNTPYRLIANPDEKKSMKDLWLGLGKKRAEVYLVKFEKIGDIKFDPFQGTSSFEEQRIEEIPIEQSQSQNPEPTPMEDAIEPIMNVTQPMTNDMGLDTVDVESVIKNKVEDILKNYFLNK